MSEDQRLMEARQLNVRGLQIRDAAGNIGDGTEIEGIAVPFNNRYKLFSDYAEVFDPDSDFGERDVKISDAHGQLIGKVTGMQRANSGLHITAKLSSTPAAKEAASLIRDGVYDSFSIGFNPVENAIKHSDDGVTEIHRRAVDLYEVAVTGIPAYPQAHITSQRSNRPQSTNEPKDTRMDKELEEAIAGIKDEQRSMKTALAKGLNPAPVKTLGNEYRSQADYLQALAKGDQAAIDLMNQTRDLISTGDTGNTVAWIADDLRLIEQRRKLMNILTHDSLPAKGMSMEYNVVTEDTTTVAKQESEGEPLKFGKVKFGTKSADIETYGGYTTLSRQVIERSTTPMLNTALKALRNAYAKATELKARSYTYNLIASQRDATENANNIPVSKTLTAMTPDDWAGLLLDAAEIMDDRNAAMSKLIVSKDVAKALVALKDTGNRFLDLSGKGSDTLGSFDLTATVGDLLRVPVQLLPGAPDGTASLFDPEAITVWESGGPTQLTNTDPTKIVDNYSVYGYMAIAGTFVQGLLPVKFTA
jgi:HK97 family phage prohead protease/HK97 family phage major capsid protein